MSEYLVRWKFAANSLINHRDVETEWYMQFHPTKKSAVEHYVNYLRNSPPAYEMTIEIFQLVKLVPGQPEPEDVVEKHPSNTNHDLDARNKKIIALHEKGSTNREIATKLDISYQTVYSVIRRLSDVK